MHRVLAVAALVAVAVACGGDPAPDDAGLHTAVTQHRSGAEVTFDATLLDQPAESGGHERFHVRAGSGDILEVDHNTSLASEVPAHAGDGVVIHGQLYVDPGAIGVHCTHAHTSRGCPEPGWIRLGGTTYQ